MNNSEIEIVKQEFKEKAESLMMLQEYQEKFDNLFLKVKLGLVTFAGVIFTIVFNKPEKFSSNFSLILAIITTLIFLLLIFDLRQKLWDLYRAIKKQYRRTKLAKIRHIAGLENLPDYDKKAEEILINEDDLTQAMRNKESITELIGYKESIYWKINFYLWVVMLVSIPILFLLAFFKIV